MSTMTIPLSELRSDLDSVLRRCADGEVTLVVELPDHRRVAILPLDEADDDLSDRVIAGSGRLRALLERSLNSPDEPFRPRADAEATDR